MLRRQCEKIKGSILATKEDPLCVDSNPKTVAGIIVETKPDPFVVD